MPAAFATNSRAFFDIKSTSLSLLTVLLKTHDLAQLAQELKQRLGETPDFFANEPILLDFSQLDDAPQTLDVAQLMHLLQSYQIVPFAVRAGNSPHIGAARAAGLIEVPDEVCLTPRTPPPQFSDAENTAETVVSNTALAADLPSLIWDKPVRSGQQIYAKGRDLIVTAVVSNGAEVIADGNVHIYGPLRGRAIAGARGNAEARIFTTCLEPELISIAGIYRTTEIALPSNIVGKSAQIRLVGEKIVIENI